MAAKNANNNDNNLGFNINAIKNVCSKYRKYIATGAMLVLLAVVISTSSKASGDKEPVDPNPAQGTVDGQSGEELEVNAYPQINKLFEDYYKYCAQGDTASIEKIAFPISDVEKSYIKMFSGYIDAYENINCYTKKGLSEGEYVVTVATEMRFHDIDTGAPNLDSFYVRRDEKGNVYIDNAYSSSNERFREDTADIEVNTLLTEFNQDEDVIKLSKEVREEYDKALEKDEKLNEMITATVQGGITDWVASFNMQTGADEENEKGGKADGKGGSEVAKGDGENTDGPDATDGGGKTDPDDAQGSGKTTDGGEGSGQGGNTAVKTRTAYTKTKVNMREKRSTNSEIIQTLNAGTKVTIYGTGKDGWFKVKCKGKTGFISKEYIVSDLSKVPVQKRTAYAKTRVNMREKRSTDSEVVLTLNAGTKVMIYGKNKDGWFKIRSKGKYGYVKKEYIVTDKSKVEREETPQAPSTPSYYSEGERITLTDSVNIRTAMSENADRVGLAYQGDVVTIIMSYAEGWSKVSWNGQTGYAKTEFLR